MKEKEADNVDNQPDDSNPKDENRIVQFLRVGEPLERLDENGEAEGHEKDGVDQGTQHLSSSPAKGVFGPLFR